MGITKVLAREWVVSINTGTYVAPVWKEIKGLNTLTFSSGKNDADTTDFNSEGYEEHIVASRNAELSIEGLYMEDPSDGTRDPGQEAVEALAELMGNDSLGDFKLISPGGAGKRFYASAEIGDVGGGNDDATSWSATNKEDTI
jgi:hypothetical protein